MKRLNKLILSFALAIGGVTGAHAGETYVPMDTGSPGVFTTQWSFSDQPTGAADDPFAGAHGAGKFFDDFFTFDVPDAQNITFTVSSVFNGSGSGVDFSGGGYALYIFTDGTLLDLQQPGTAASMSGGSWLLTSGTYTLEIAGEFATTGGIYSGAITGNPAAVPEPSGLLLLLAGLATLTGVAQLRKRPS